VETPELSRKGLLDAIKELAICPITVFVTGFDHYAIKAIKESALDYLVKPVDIDELRRVVDKINTKLLTPTTSSKIDSIEDLTPTEKEVLKILATGKTSSQTAKILNSSPSTINSHRNNILKKLQCNSILELLNLIQRG